MAKAGLRNGDWPEDLLDPIRKAYRRCMLGVLERASAVDGDQEAAKIAARSVAGWCLPESVREHCCFFFLKAANDITPADLADFVAKTCASETLREELVTSVLERFVDRREDLPDTAQVAIEHLCAFTVCFGNSA